MRRWLILLPVFVILLSLWLGFNASKLTFNYDIRRFFPEGNPEIEYYQAHREKFTTDNDFTLIALFPDKGVHVLDAAFLQRVDSLEKELNQLSHVRSTLSLLSARRYIMGPSGPFPIPWVHPYDSNKMYRDTARVAASSFMSGNLVASDQSSLVIILFSTEELSKKKCDTLFANINNTLTKHQFLDAKLAGRIPGQIYYLEVLIKEFALYTTTSFMLVLLILVFLFRNVWGVMLPVIVISLSALWTLGIAALLNKPIDPFTSLLPMILFVVGTSDIIHIFSRYLEELRKGTPKTSALKISVREIGIATLLTSTTTAIGFLTLYSNPIEPVKTFGLISAVGVGVAYILTILFFPLILYFAPVPKRALIGVQNLWWNQKLEILSNYVSNNYRTILLGFGIVILLSLLSISQVKINNYLLDDLSPNDPLKKTFSFFDQNYGGVRPIEFGVHSLAKPLDSFEALSELQMLEDYLKKQFDLSSIQSPAEPYKMLNMTMTAGEERNYKVPRLEADYIATKRWADRFYKSGKFASFITEDRRSGRIAARMHDPGSSVLYNKYDSLQAFINRTDFKYISIRPTGTAFLIDESNKHVSKNLMYGLIIAMMAIAGIAGWMFRSLIMIVISIVVNVIPLIFAAGIMGLVGADLKVATAIIFTIAFGIAVDDTIHFLSRLRVEQQHLPYREAVLKTLRTTGKAIILTSIVLVSGFAVLVMSAFASTFYIGLLISLSLIMAVLADILLLPVLLLWWYRPKNQ
jgi:predicted RND superfamily exporter protein